MYHLWDCSTNNSNQWFLFRNPPIHKLAKIPNNWLNIRGSTGLCVAVSDKNGERLTQQKCGNENNLLWKIQQIDNQFIISNKNGLVLENYQTKGNNGNPIISSDRTNAKNQKWDIENLKNEKILIKDSVNNKCFDDTGKKSSSNRFGM